MLNILGITCGQLAPFMRILSFLLKFLKICIPIVLIVMVVIDLVKAISANEEKKMNDAKNIILKRVIYAVIIYLVPTIISLLFKGFGSAVSTGELSGATEWISCFNRFY